MSEEIRMAAADLAEMNRLRLLNADLHVQLTQARERERVVNETYDQQQSSYRELETLYQASQERALKAEADAAALNDSCQAWIEGHSKWRKRAEQAETVLTDLVNQLTLLTRDDVTYLWRIGGRPLDEAYKAAKRVVMKEGGE